MRVSIIIRNYNYEAYIGDAVDSALAQTHPDIEVIVVDDGSTDGSRRILQSYGDRIRLILQENGGEGAAANAGFAAASGEMVIFLDSDDVLMPDCVARAAAAMTQGVTRVHWWMYLIDADGRLTGHVQPPAPVPRWSFEESMRRFGCMTDVGQSFNAYRRETLAPAFPLDPQGWMRGPDVFMTAVCAAAGETAFLDAPLGGYRVHDRNLSLVNSLDVSKNHYSLRIIPQLHADLAAVLGPERARQVGFAFPLVHWRNRLASLRLAPETHPYPEDRRGELVARSIESIRRRVWTSWGRKAVLIAGTLALGYLPRQVLRPLYPAMARVARHISLFRGGRRLFRETVPPGVRRGMHWREAFRVEPAGPSRPSPAAERSPARGAAPGRGAQRAVG